MKVASHLLSGYAPQFFCLMLFSGFITYPTPQLFAQESGENKSASCAYTTPLKNKTPEQRSSYFETEKNRVNADHARNCMQLCWEKECSGSEDSQGLQDITEPTEDSNSGGQMPQLPQPPSSEQPPSDSTPTDQPDACVDNDCQNPPTFFAPDGETLNDPYNQDGQLPGAYAPESDMYDNPLNTYSGPKGAGELSDVARYAGDLATPPPEGFTPESVMDYSRLSEVSDLTPLEWQRQGLLSDKGLLEKGHQGLTQGLDTSNSTINTLTPQDFGTSRIDPEYRNNTFANLYENKVAPDFWNNLNFDERQVAAINYLSDVTGRMTPEQASGVVGNLIKESPGLEPLQRQLRSGPGVGFAQWGLIKDGNRGGTLQDYAGQKFSGEYTLSPAQRQETGLFSDRHFSDGPGALSQLSFIDAEMNRHAPVRDRLAESVARTFRAQPEMSPESAAKLFQNKYERPNDRTGSLQTRQSFARQAYETYLQYRPEPRS